MVTKLAALDASGASPLESKSGATPTPRGRAAAGRMLAARHMAQPPRRAGAEADSAAGRRRRPQRNPLYSSPTPHVVHHFIPTMPLRVSALRALGAYTTYSRSRASWTSWPSGRCRPGRIPPEASQDPRARDVVEKAAREFGWQKGQKGAADRGYGFAFARYKNLGAYCAMAIEVEVEPGDRASASGACVAAVDSGQASTPTGSSTR